ncbi:MAG: DUF4954 family protein [Bacteroidales bacterium]
MKHYRKLSKEEQKQLQKQGCTSDNWDEIHVDPSFRPDNIITCCFSGTNYLGLYTDAVEYPGGVKKTAGLYNAHFHNCVIGDQVVISNVMNYVANYRISNHVVVENVDLIMLDGATAFGNGTMVNVLDETGGRRLMIYDRLSAHLAYIMVLYRHRKHLLPSIERMINDYVAKNTSEQGFIGAHTWIMNSGRIINVRIGEQARINGASRLYEGSINSHISDPVKIGDNVVADHFIISSGSEVSSHTIIDNCFIGQGCRLLKHYSATHSVFFANAEGFGGEACSIFAGPFTITHHKSTLLIGGMFSFANAGSGSNQSNHMYKLGPVHHGLVERGSRTTSESYLLWPAKIGAFTLIMGHHYTNPDTSRMPFSYLIKNKERAWLVPAVNLRSVGTIRDTMKWLRRDKRKDPDKLDCINYKLLTPFTAERILQGKDILENLANKGEMKDDHTWNALYISQKALVRGIQLYSMAIVKFLGNCLISRIELYKPTNRPELIACLTPKTAKGKGSWVDLAGLIAPKNEIEHLLDQLESAEINRLEETEMFFRSLHDHYNDYEWTWAADSLERYMQKAIHEMSPEDLISFIEKWKESVIGLDEQLYEDAQKEFRESAMTVFGPDGERQTKEDDFKAVRGTLEENQFVQVIQDHIRRKSDLADIAIKSLKAL